MHKESIADGVDCYWADCRDVIPVLRHGKVSAVITDPPYGIEDLVGGYSRKRSVIVNDKSLDTCMEGLKLCSKIANDTWFAVFYSPRVREEFFSLVPERLRNFGELVWDKKAPGLGYGSIRYQHENIAIFRTGTDAKFHLETFSVLSFATVANLHPHEKPVRLMGKLCQMMATGKQMVLDPFMGVGTTGVAAVRLGLKFTGIEIDKKYFDIACKNIDKALREPSLFIEKPKPASGYFDQHITTKRRRKAG